MDVQAEGPTQPTLSRRLEEDPADDFSVGKAAQHTKDADAMDGLEARRLREASGMSQTDFGIALGLSRATIWRIERSLEKLDRRTELAMRYVAERRPARVPELREIHEAVAQVLDQTAARDTPPFDYRDRLQAAVAHWGVTRGATKAQTLLGRAQAVLGLLNVTTADDPQKERTLEQLRLLRLAWGAVLSDD